MRPDKWRERARRLLDLARKAREANDDKWAEHLTARAEQYFDKANAVEAVHGLRDDRPSYLSKTNNQANSLAQPTVPIRSPTSNRGENEIV